jgi:hypothetical protein
MATEIIRTLCDGGDIEASDTSEAELDVQAVLKEYARLDREITDKSKDLLQQRNLPYEQFGKLRRAVAEERGFGLGEEGLSWIMNQLLESFMHSANIEEVFSDDTTLRLKLREVLKRHMMVDEELDAEVRGRIRNLQEGTQTWDVEYARVMDQMKRKHGLE